MALSRRLLAPIVELRENESGIAALMFAYSFLAMTAYNIIQPITRSRFISSLGADNLPYVLLVSVFIVGGIMQGYSRLGSLLPAKWVVPATQGAMVVHRNLHALAQSPNLTAALLIADGDRIPDDNTVNVGSAPSDPETVGGAAQDWPTLAHAPEKLPANVGTRTISVCDAGDAVCDYDPDADEVSPKAVAIHKSYIAGASDGQMWTWMVHQLLGPPSQATPEVVATST